ncbi:uncharacterized protein SPSC_03093 [Sporisorium scitamineum]|uniref:LIM zinc-binding domain-containing protein n=1 Tax=Sporisorium scitamineum TaxID=49012 RepID=A0A0F7SBI1_9BASI|nr:uncharacterized protein SPSC_03093 [Sporisorium scitamineum]CDW98113.1 hypothetical protein [Sporisorium scitamineum]
MPRFAVPAAPKCARCNTSVFLAEQVIGPASKPYHKTCLTCVVCNKRLDSTLLVEHDGEPYCKNCHKEHLGTGKGGFAKAVSLNPTSPKSPRSPVSNLSNATRSPLSTPSRPGATLVQQQYNTPETTLSRGLPDSARRSPSPTKFTPGASLVGNEDQVPGIRIRSRGIGATSPLASPPSPTKAASSSVFPARSTPGRTGTAVSTAPVRSIDEAIASGGTDMDDPVARIQAAVSGMNISNTSSKPTSAHANDDSFDEDTRVPGPTQSVTGHTIPSVDYYATPSPPPAQNRATPSSKSQYTEEASFAEDGTPITIQTRRIAATDTIGSIRFSGTANGTGSPTPAPKVNTQSPLSAIGQLPPPRRPDPKTLTGASGTAKIAPPRTLTNPAIPPSSSSDDQLGSRRKSGIDRIGLSSSIVDAGGGTPLCARCVRPVYFAEQKAAAGRKWHRGCLRCDGCNTTLESGKLEEGPAEKNPAAPQGGANVWCRICYAKFFGPKNLAVGLSLPETMR